MGTAAMDDTDRRLANATRSLHTYVAPAADAYHLNGQMCRVCKEPIRGGVHAFRKRQYCLEYAHEACGWFAPTETRTPYMLTRPGTSFVYWQWECPSCGLDACAPRKPREDDPHECKRCRPTPKIEVGTMVETIEAQRVDMVQGKKSRSVRVDRYTRGKVTRVHETLSASGEPYVAAAYVRFPKADVPAEYVWLRTLILSAI